MKKISKSVFLLLILLLPVIIFSQVNKAIIQNIEINANDNINISDLLTRSGLAANSPYDPLKNPEIASGINNYLHNRGYLYARVNKISTRYNSDSSLVDLTIQVEPGPLVQFGKISISSDSIAASV